MTLIVCPVCAQVLHQRSREPVARPHADRLGHMCPMSGHPVAGATVKKKKAHQ